MYNLYCNIVIFFFKMHFDNSKIIGLALGIALPLLLVFLYLIAIFVVYFVYIVKSKQAKAQENNK